MLAKPISRGPLRNPDIAHDLYGDFLVFENVLDGGGEAVGGTIGMGKKEERFDHLDFRDDDFLRPTDLHFSKAAWSGVALKKLPSMAWLWA